MFNLFGKIGEAAGGAGGLLKGASGMLKNASDVLGPFGSALKVGNMLYGAWNAGKQNKKEIKALGKKSEKINTQMIDNASDLRDNLADVDEEFQGELANTNEMIGEKLEESGTALGQTISKGKGLLTGDTEIQKQDIIDDTGNFQDTETKRLETRRGGQYSSFIDPHMQGVEQNQQGLLDIATQRKQLEKKDSMWENLIG